MTLIERHWQPAMVTSMQRLVSRQSRRIALVPVARCNFKMSFAQGKIGWHLSIDRVEAGSHPGKEKAGKRIHRSPATPVFSLN
jgi:hypothetical protein